MPLNPYHMTVNLAGFAPYVQDIDVRSAVPLNLKVTLQISATAENVTVQGEAGDLVENDPTFHTDVDRNSVRKLPLESTSSELSSLVTLASPGVAADSNGLFHGLGDHAENSFSLDGQPITDQQSKVFSNQIPLDAVQSMTGDCGRAAGRIRRQDQPGHRRDHPLGTGSHDPSRQHHHLLRHLRHVERGRRFLLRRQELGKLHRGQRTEYAAASSIRRSSQVFHDHGNEENVFDRFDYQLSNSGRASPEFQLHPLLVSELPIRTTSSSTISVASLNTNPVTGVPLGPTDQRSKILTFNIAPTWTHTISPNAVLNVTGFVRRDAYQLLSQRRSVRRSWPGESAAGNHCPAANAC